MTPPKERLVTFAAVAGMVSTLLVSIYLPGRAGDAALRAEIAAAEAEIARGPLVLEEFKAVQTELDACRKYLDESAAAVAPADPHDLLGGISRLAQESRLTISKLEPEPPRLRESYSEHSFRLDFHGDLAALVKFLRGLETGPRLYSVDELAIRDTRGEENQESLEGTLRFATFAANSDFAGFSENVAAAGLP